MNIHFKLSTFKKSNIQRHILEVVYGSGKFSTDVHPGTQLYATHCYTADCIFFKFIIATLEL